MVLCCCCNQCVELGCFNQDKQWCFEDYQVVVLVFVVWYVLESWNLIVKLSYVCKQLNDGIQVVVIF